MYIALVFEMILCICILLHYLHVFPFYPLF